MKNINCTILLIFLSAFCAMAISAQQTQPSPSTEELQKRISQMEAEMKEMREELARIKQSFPVSQTAPQTVTNDSTVAKSETKTEAKTETKTKSKTESKPNQTGEATKQTTQQKTLGVDIGSARLTPYGTIYFNAFGNSGGTNNADVPLFVTPTSFKLAENFADCKLCIC